MIDLYTWGTSNGRKASIMLEECGLEYTVHPINITQDDQFSPGFIAINPNSKIPAIVDQDAEGGPYTVIESGAILMYLGDKTGLLFATEQRKRYDIIQWLMWQMGGVGPNFGQVHHFLRSQEARKVSYGVERYTKEMRRLYGVLNDRLEGRDFICDDYSIADIATFPWVLRYEWQEVDLAEWPSVKRWFDTIHARPAVQKGITIPSAP